MHCLVQYCCAVRHAKLHVLPSVHDRPVSSAAQYCSFPIAWQMVPVMHCPVDAQSRVQRFASPLAMLRHTSGAAHSASPPHASSSCFVAGPPLLLLPELLLALVLLLPELLLAPLLLDDDPPMPELLLDDPPPLLLLPELLLALAPGTHCAVAVQV